jgi:hypothetical protein
LIRKATLTLLRVVSVATGIHSESTQKEAVGTLCGLMRNIVDCGCNYGLSMFILLSYFKFIPVKKFLSKNVCCMKDNMMR